jgi:hypothetical protein
MSGSGIKDIFPLLSQRLIMGENDRHPTAKSALGIYTPLSKRNPWPIHLRSTTLQVSPVSVGGLCDRHKYNTP